MQTATPTQLDYKSLFASLPGLYLVLTPELQIADASDAYLKATLTQRENILGKYLFDVFPDNPETPEAMATANLAHSLQQVLQHCRPHTMPVQRYDIPRPVNLGKGFEERYWLPANFPVMDENGNLQYIIHQVIDVTMQQMAQLHIFGNRERIEILAQATTDVLWDVDLLSNYIWWSDSLEQVFGYTRNELAFMEDWDRIVHPEDKVRVINGLAAEIDQGSRYWTDSYRLQRKDGNYANVLERGYILRDEKGIAYRMVGSMFDITGQISPQA